MSMTTPAHPDPERLAALAGADPDALADRELGSHVAVCESCGPQVRELTALRAALAELPDLAPSRPLRLLPPVAEPAPSSGWRTAFRRAFAPVAVAGMVLLLVGSVGVTGVLGPADAQELLGRFSLGAQAPAPAEAPETYATDSAGNDAGAAETAAPGAADSQAASPEGTRGLAGPAVSPSPVADEQTAPTDSTAQVIGETESGRDGDLAVVEDRAGWIAAALLGIGLLGLAFVLRRSAAPAESGVSR
jgi:hypothetical protein